MGARAVIVIDTHVLIWLIILPERIGASAREVLREAIASEQVRVPAITPWEIAMSADKGRINFNMPIGDWIRSALDRPGIELAGLTPATAVDAGTLPGDTHGDPVARLIIATARSLGCPVLTADRKILDYAAAGHVQAIDALR